MRTRMLRIAMKAVLVATGGYLMTGAGCINFIGESALTLTDFCFILDCTDAVGGTIEFCSGQGSGSQTFESQNSLPLLNDCPGP